MTDLLHFAVTAFAMAGAALGLCGMGLVQITPSYVPVKEARR